MQRRGFLNYLGIFATRCFAGLTLCDSIRKRSKACFTPFFDIVVELFMRTYIVTLDAHLALDLKKLVDSAIEKKRGRCESSSHSQRKLGCTKLYQNAARA
jgi:hypothetical protein